MSSILRSFGIGAPKTWIVSVVAAAGLAMIAAPATAAEEGETVHYPLNKPALESWSFAGFFGRYDQVQLQRGFQVYREVCAACHGLELVAFRNLGDEGGPHFTEAEVRQLASEYQIADGPNEEGEMFERPGRASDYFPNPFPNPQAAAFALGGAAAPDLSLMAKARGVAQGIQWTILDFFTQYQEGGVDYMHALLTGYEDAPPGTDLAGDGYYNPYFISGTVIAMPPPLSDGLVTYVDGSPETVDQYSRDVSAFLMWAAEPHLVERKRIGFQVFIFLVIFAGLMYFTKKKVWSSVKH